MRDVKREGRQGSAGRGNPGDVDRGGLHAAADQSGDFIDVGGGRAEAANLETDVLVREGEQKSVRRRLERSPITYRHRIDILPVDADTSYSGQAEVDRRRVAEPRLRLTEPEGSNRHPVPP